MKHLPLKPAELKINPSDPWCDDKLNRKICADRLTEILTSQMMGSLTVSLNGKWGTGKTYLLKRWKQQLCNEGYVAVYFNAWEDDCLNDPLVALISQLWISLDCKKYNITENVLKSTGSIVADLIQNKTGIDLKKLKEINKADEMNVLDQYIQSTKSREALISKLNNLSIRVFENTNKPLIFIVDELDRCRPTFAIETLERIKHLFCIDHVIFVLGIDREQLGLSIQSVYGNIDIENYLHRFIDLNLLMPHPDPLSFFDWLADNEINTFVENILVGNEREKALWDEFKSNLKDLVSNQHFSLREIEHFFVLMRWMLNINKGNFHNAILSAVLVVLKISNPVMYYQYINMEITPNKVIDYLIPENYQMDSYYAVLLACMIYSSYLSEYSKNDNAAQQKIAEVLINILDGDLSSRDPLYAQCIVDLYDKDQLDKLHLINGNPWLCDFEIQRTIHIDTIKNLSQQLEMDYLVKPNT